MRLFVGEEIIPIDSKKRIRLKFFREKGKGFVNFVRQIEIKRNDEWKVVVRYDCFHGFLHKDVYSPDGRKRKIRIGKPFRDIREAMKIAETDLTENVESYLEGWEDED